MEELRAKLLIESHSRASGQRARHTSAHQTPPMWRAPEGSTAVPVGGGGARPGFRATRQPHVSTPNAAGVEGARGICRGAGGRRRGQAGLRGDAPATRQHTKRRRCGGRRRDLPRCRWAAAGPGRASSRRTQPHISDQAPPVWRAPEGSAAVPVGGGGAWPGFEATRRAKLAARTARGRAAAHRHTQRPGPTAPGTPAEPQRNEAATGCPATASSRSCSAVHNSATSDQAVMSTWSSTAARPASRRATGTRNGEQDT